MKKWIAVLLILVLFTGCAPQNSSTDLTPAPHLTPTGPQIPKQPPAALELGLALLGQSQEENPILSPLSVMTALSMAAVGAEGETLAQMDALLGSDRESRNLYLLCLLTALQGKEVNLANGIWIRDTPELQVREAFLQDNADYFRSSVFKAPFDGSTLKHINGWVEEQTHGEIKDILDQIPDSAMLYLVNALAFEAEWKDVYMEHQVREGTFTTENEEQQDCRMMYSAEWGYLENPWATGFVKPYSGDRYGFAALLPREGVTMDTLLEKLDAAELTEALLEPQEVRVHARMPKFEAEYGEDLVRALEDLGMTDAFSWETADFSSLGTPPEGTNFFISRVIHKARIAVAEQGTKAGAATVVEMTAEGAMEEEVKNVILDRPFLYLIYHRETGVPLFVGILDRIETS